MALHVPAEAFLGMGLTIKMKGQRWRRRGMETNTEDFHKWIGVSEATCECLWLDLQNYCNMDTRIIRPKHLLLVLRFVKGYDYEWKLADDFNMCDMTVRKYCKLLLPKLHKLKELKVCHNRSLTSSIGC